MRYYVSKETAIDLLSKLIEQKEESLLKFQDKNKRMADSATNDRYWYSTQTSFMKNEISKRKEEVKRLKKFDISQVEIEHCDWEDLEGSRIE